MNILKHFYLLTVLLAGMLVCSPPGAAQVSIGVETPDASAVLHLSSTEKGLLLPRMTTTEMTCIQNPANGLIVFSTTDEKIYVYNANELKWKEVHSGTAVEHPASYLIGNGEACSNTAVYGHYQDRSFITGDNRVELLASVTSVGVWQITTDTLNGYSFSGKGTFTSTVDQMVTLTFSGVPLAPQTDQFTATASNTGGSCTFPVTVGAACPSQITDNRDGNTYSTIVIGAQCWMQENLNAGLRIDGNQQQLDNGTIEKYCYNDLESNCDSYGGLYLWNEIMQYSTVEGGQGICPPSGGWHLPTYGEWSTMITHLGGDNTAGGKMKEAGYTHWSEPNEGADNSSGFTALPGGFRNNNGSYNNLGAIGIYWTSTEQSETDSWHKSLVYDGTNIEEDYISKDYGFSVRCLKDDYLPGLEAPGSAIHVSMDTMIVWKWYPVTGATGYKWNTVNDFNSAIDVGTGTLLTETGLTVDVTYTRYVWAYDSSRISQETEITKSTQIWECGHPYPDLRDGKAYNTVLIGTQCWMQENLNIGKWITGHRNPRNDGVIEKYCYEDNETNCDVYGGLYQWDEMMHYTTAQGAQGICPPDGGWHIPTDAEWAELITYLGGESVAGGKLKEAGYAHWLEPNTGADNSSGFTALPGGNRDVPLNFYRLGILSHFWSSTKKDQESVWIYSMDYSSSTAHRTDNYKNSSFSLRCLKYD